MVGGLHIVVDGTQIDVVDGAFLNKGTLIPKKMRLLIGQKEDIIVG